MSAAEQDKVFDQVGSAFLPFHDVEAALARIEALYDEGVTRLREAFSERRPAESFYPYLAFPLQRGGIPHDVKPRFGVLLEPGFYGTTLTRPILFRSYWRAQIENLIECYRQPVYVGLSKRPMPLPYVMEESVTGLTEADLRRLQDNYALPDLHATDDTIANCDIIPDPEAPRALALFTAERTDYSLARLHHYAGTSPRHFQRFILLTNYQRYVDGFRDYARAQIDAGGEYDSFVEPGDAVYSRAGQEGQPATSLPQMPAYHLCRKDGDGITLINIGVGPSNAKTITDHLAVLRPHCWLMVGHCAGLRRTQLLGDYVLAHGYVRDDHVLDDDLRHGCLCHRLPRCRLRCSRPCSASRVWKTATSRRACGLVRS